MDRLYVVGQRGVGRSFRIDWRLVNGPLWKKARFGLEHFSLRAITPRSGLVPAIPLMFLLPLLPESPAWKERRAAGTLKRPSIAQLFQPAFRRTTIATAILFACAYGAAFGAIQMTPQIVPGLVPGLPELAKLRKQVEVAQQKGEDAKEMKKRIAELS